MTLTHTDIVKQIVAAYPKGTQAPPTPRLVDMVVRTQAWTDDTRPELVAVAEALLAKVKAWAAYHERKKTEGKYVPGWRAFVLAYGADASIPDEWLPPKAVEPARVETPAEWVYGLPDDQRDAVLQRAREMIQAGPAGTRSRARYTARRDIEACGVWREVLGKLRGGA